MKFIICALYYNNIWNNTSLCPLTGDESGMYIEGEGFVFANSKGLHKATMYDYDEAIEKLKKINDKYGKKHPDHGFVIMSDTFRGRGKY